MNARFKSPAVVAALVGVAICPIGWLLLSLVYGFSGVDLAARAATLVGSALILGPGIAYNVAPSNGERPGRWLATTAFAALAGVAIALLVGIGISELV